ncbi:MAG TPA: anhydro-N-acetylmuramic acid kinase [Bacteroidales bacterium]|nr:anhydro-N-acetylmuramic acid kinase [Bacteroidales bacterium]
MKLTSTPIIAGLMSGTSLDGLDIAVCQFNQQDEGWGYRILAAATIPYPEEWTDKLRMAYHMQGRDLWELHVQFGRYCGVQLRNLLDERGLKAEMAVSHGHTVFHQPSSGYTVQIGDGAALAAASGLPVVCDLRSLDVAHGGQGAPLVPLGDALLFGEFAACINLGGYGNISFDSAGTRLAFDICPVNNILNLLARKEGFAYDKGGHLASKGAIDAVLLQEWNALPYYHLTGPRSLGQEWFEAEFLGILNRHNLEVPDLLRTATEHIAMQLARVLEVVDPGQVLFTGGGCFNTFLLKRIRHHIRHTPVVPDEILINYKEALIFAFLGLLRVQEKDNCLASVTGARRNCSGGAIYLP